MKVVVGIDEAGRGSIFGPVYAAAVIWNDDVSHKWLKDSKMLSNSQRSFMKDFILEHSIDFGIGSASPSEIDSLNILNATILAMHRALDNLTLDYDSIYVDGTQFKEYKKKEHKCIIKGDQKYKSISAASILAKVYHDEYILNCKECKLYNLNKGKGYGTKEHFNLLQKYGISDNHRKSFLKKFNPSGTKASSTSEVVYKE